MGSKISSWSWRRKTRLSRKVRTHLPEAQLDRFLLHVEVGYPTTEDERRILVLNRDEAKVGESAMRFNRRSCCQWIRS